MVSKNKFILDISSFYESLIAFFGLMNKVSISHVHLYSIDILRSL